MPHRYPTRNCGKRRIFPNSFEAFVFHSHQAEEQASLRFASASYGRASIRDGYLRKLYFFLWRLCAGWWPVPIYTISITIRPDFTLVFNTFQPVLNNRNTQTFDNPHARFMLCKTTITRNSPFYFADWHGSRAASLFCSTTVSEVERRPPQNGLTL